MAQVEGPLIRLPDKYRAMLRHRKAAGRFVCVEGLPVLEVLLCEIYSPDC